MSKKVIIIIIAVSFLFMGMIGGGFFLMWTKMSSVIAQGEKVDKEEDENSEENKKKNEDTAGPIFSLDTFVVNLADQGGKRYLRATMELELNGQDVYVELEKSLPKVRDSILMILPTKNYQDVSSVEGKTALRDEMIARLNSFLSKGSVTNIYFTEFVIQ